MSRTTSTLALLAAAMLAVSVVGATPALASDGSLSVSASTNDDGSATVTVAHNDTDDDTAAENATVTVEAVDNTSYAGTGTYSTDENGTVSLPAHDGNETAELEITAEYDGASASTTLTLEPADETNDTDPFGQEVAAFIAQLETTDGGIGSQVADFVLANNPGDPPDHAGPPDDDGNETDTGNETDDGQGPPDHAGPPDDDSDDDERGGGPPDHAGPPDDSDDDDSDEDEDA